VNSISEFVMGAFGKTIALATVGLLIGTAPMLGKDKPVTAKTLDQSIDSVKSKDNSDYLKYQLGVTEVDPSVLKTGQLEASDPSAEAIAALLGATSAAPAPTAQTSVGFKELPFEQGHFLGWLYSDPGSANENPTPRLSVGLFSKKPQDPKSVELIGKPKLNIPLRAGEQMAAFDFAPYGLGPLGRAFGVRTTVGGCGAGGSICSNGYLKLFVPQNGGLQMVFNEAVSRFGSYGGEWNKDGTRQHTIVEENGVIIVNSDNAALVPSLILRAKIDGKSKQRTFKPVTGNDGASIYQAVSPPIIELVDE
jgi:hypothetical protein